MFNGNWYHPIFFCNIGVPNLLYPLLPVGPESYWEAPAENSRDATSGWAVGRAKDPGVKSSWTEVLKSAVVAEPTRKNTWTYKLSNQKQRWHGHDLPIFKPRSSGGSKVSMEGSPHNTLLGLFSSYDRITQINASYIYILIDQFCKWFFPHAFLSLSYIMFVFPFFLLHTCWSFFATPNGPHLIAMGSVDASVTGCRFEGLETLKRWSWLSHVTTFHQAISVILFINLFCFCIQ